MVILGHFGITLQRKCLITWFNANFFQKGGSSHNTYFIRWFATIFLGVIIISKVVYIGILTRINKEVRWIG